LLTPPVLFWALVTFFVVPLVLFLATAAVLLTPPGLFWVLVAFFLAPPVLFLALLDFFALEELFEAGLLLEEAERLRAEPLFFPPAETLFTVAHARFSASFSPTPCFSYS